MPLPIRALRPLLWAIACVAAALPAHAASTAAHAMTVSGLAQGGVGPFGCATSGPQPAVLARFNTGVGLPTEGYAGCHLAGSIQDHASASGPSSAHLSLVNAFGNGTHVQTADAVADFGVLKVASSGSYGGDAIGGFAFHAGEAAATVTDTLPTPDGAAFFSFGVTIDGAASVLRTSQILTLFNYQIDAGPIYGIFTADLIGNNTAFVRDQYGPVSGYTVTPNSLAGSGTVLPFLSGVTAGVPFDLTLGLYAASYPSPFGGAADNSFIETARVSSVQFYDAAMRPIAASVTGASGRIYDATGVHAALPPVSSVPEPQTWASMLLGLALVGTAARARRRRRD